MYSDKYYVAYNQKNLFLLELPATFFKNLIL
jgi:hypothetical protein